MGMKVRNISAAQDAHGHESVKGSDENRLQKRPGSYKVTETGHERDSGTTDAELAGAAESLYDRAKRNAGDKMGDHAIQDR